MRKFISAVTSLAVAASMASVFVPAATVAEDATKGLTLEAFAESDSKYAAMGDTITVSEADIAAGDVTIPCAVYLHETEHCKTVASSFYVSGGPDASKVVFKAHTITDPYWSSPHDYTIDGEAFKTDRYVSFAGSYDPIDEVYAAYGLTNLTCVNGQKALDIDTYYIAYNWGAAEAYSYTGATSDEHPVLVFDVILPKGTAAGDYTIDFTSANTSPEEGKNNPATMIEAKQRYTKELGNLDLNTLKITVEGKGNVPDDKTTTTTTTTTKKPNDTTTTTTNKNPNPDADVIFDFGVHKANPGDKVKVPVIINPQGNGIIAINGIFETESPIKFSQQGKTSAAFGGITFQTNSDGGFTITPVKDGSDPTFIEDGLVFVNAVFEVPADCPDGKYHIGLSNKGRDTEVFKDNTNTLSFAVINGIIEVGDAPDDTTTTTTTKPDDKTTTTTTTTSSTSSTSSSTTTTNNTPDPSGEYAPTWGDTNCDGTVNVADVVVLNKWLHDSSAIAISDQGKVNADCCDPQDAKGGKVKVSGVKLTAADSNAIIESIVGNVTLPTSSK